MTENRRVPPAPDAIREQLLRAPGVDPAWSRTVRAPDAEGTPRVWHVLDTHAQRPSGDVEGTILAVHGNPTWSYLWRRVLAAAPAGWRVVAVDQLGMGFSEEPTGSMEHPRSLQQRIDDLGGLTDVLDLGSRVVAAGHDWGGMVATGWALAHREVLAGLILANTTVHHDFDGGLPTALRFSRAASLLRRVTVDTPTFVRAATFVSSPRPSRDVRAAYALPYRTSRDRRFVGQFVADIPTDPGHRTRATMDSLAAGLSALGAEPPQTRVPVLLLRGPKDPVFSEGHLRDLRRRLPHADVHRYEGTSHLVVEDAPTAGTDIAAWITSRVEQPVGDESSNDAGRPAPGPTAVGTSTRPWAGMTEMARRRPDALAVAAVRDGRAAHSVTFGQLDTDVEHVALALRAGGVRPGDRVGLLVEPGVDLTVAAYASWRVGAVIVVADAGLGLAGLGRALRGAGTAHVMASPKGLAALPALRVPGQRFLAGELPAPARRALRVEATFAQLREQGRELAARGETLPEVFTGDADAAVLFTSGATGPSKGVVYTVDQLRAQIGAFGSLYRLRPGDRLVAAFAPFALYGPALGVAGVTPDMQVTAPGSLTATALADAVRVAEATTVFASPAALRNVLATSEALDGERREALGRIEILMSAGAPVSAALLRRLRTLMPNAELHTPYGMTECLPVADITLDELDDLPAEAATVEGVCVGRPVEGVEAAIAPLPDQPDGQDGPLTTTPGITGEICVRAAHVKDRYDQLWATDRVTAERPVGWHRTGDVGHLDDHGRLWVEGRRVHVVHTPDGPVTPVGLEQRVEDLSEVRAAAVVGVGPVGTQQVVVVIVPEEATARTTRAQTDTTPSGVEQPDIEQTDAAEAAAGRAGRGRRANVLADDSLAARVRDLSSHPVAAVLVRDSLPVDVRHQSKVDRSAVADWASEVLTGGRSCR